MTPSGIGASASRIHRYRRDVRALSSVQKTSRGAPAYSRWVNRWLGRRLAAGANLVGATPNGVTALSAVLTFAAIALIGLVTVTPALAVVVVAGLVLGYALDSADGQLARLQGTGSRAGEWLDHVVDAGKVGTLHLAVVVACFRFTDLPIAWLLVPLGYSAIGVVFFCAMILTDQLRRAAAGGRGHFTQADGSSSTAYSLAVLPTDYGLTCFVLGLLAWPTVFAWAYTAMFAANAAFLTLALPKWFREMRRLVPVGVSTSS